jgi:hypothetical protein
MDFTLIIYRLLIRSLISKGYKFVTLKDYIHNKSNIKDNSLTIILRHDVDRMPQNSLNTAEIEHSLGINGSYYFRIVPESLDIKIIRKIARLGHEIGYHYEDVDMVLKSQKSKIKNKVGEIDIEQLTDLAYESFCKNIEQIRNITEIQTICMHGSPLSKFDNKIIWDKYDYHKLGIICEPYLDLNWNEFGYLTDTGRRWNGDNVSVRDKIRSKNIFNFKSTFDIIKNIDALPAHLMFTVHPQRWNSSLSKWTIEFIAQSSKNVIKKHFFVR